MLVSILVGHLMKILLLSQPIDLIEFNEMLLTMSLRSTSFSD